MVSVDTPTAYISIHAPREGGRQQHTEICMSLLQISIHAPREGGDDTLIENSASKIISIHAPREGGDRAGSQTGA